MVNLVGELPASWSMIKLRECFTEAIGGANILSSEYSERGVPVILKSDVQPMLASTVPTKFIPTKVATAKYSNKLVKENDLLLCMRDLSQKANILGLITVCAENQTGNVVAQGVSILRGCLIDRQYLSYFSNTKNFREYIQRVKRGSTQVHLGNDDVFNIAIPLPPLAEQGRIVRKVENVRIKLDAIDLSLKNARELISKYKESLLAKAFRGQLVPQKSDAETASDLLKRIRLVREKSLSGKGKNNLPPVTQEDMPFEIPKTWEWVRLGEIVDSCLGKMLDAAKNRGTLRQYIGNINVRWFKFDLSDLKEMKVEDSELDRFSVKAGDLMICEGGEPGRAAVWEEDKTVYFQKALHRVRPLGGINPHYLLHWLAYQANSGQLANYFTGAAIKHLVGDNLRKLLVPLPPVSEQNAIVSSLTSNIKRLDDVNQKISELLTVSTVLNSSVLEKAFLGTLVAQSASEGTGQDLECKIKAKASAGAQTKSTSKVDSANRSKRKPK